MKLTLYRRTYPVQDAPVSLSFVPFATRQRYTFPVGERVYEATYSELHIDAPDGSRVDQLRDRVVWDGGRRRVSSTAREVFDLAFVGELGFALA